MLKIIAVKSSIFLFQFTRMIIFFVSLVDISQLNDLKIKLETVMLLILLKRLMTSKDVHWI